MRFSLLIIIFFIFSCSTNITKFENRKPYSSKGFAYIYNKNDFEKKIIGAKLDNSKLQISHNLLNTNSLIKIINPKTNDSIIIKNWKKTKFPDFYKILITKKVADKLNLDKNLPLVEVLEIKKNKSFIAKKAKIFNEEKKISSKAPVTSVKIKNISKYKKSTKTKKNEMFILIATFYSNDVASFLKQRISKEIPAYDNNKLKIRKKSNKEIELISGPYKAINFMKNDYILLKNFGFEELDIVINE